MKQEETRAGNKSDLVVY
jgi:hypothetical protein